MGYFNVFFSGTFKNDNFLSFKTQLIYELNYSVKTYDHFKSEIVDLNCYNLGLLDNNRNFSEFKVMKEAFFKDLINSLRNLTIVGINFTIEKFMSHDIFNRWFENYTNRRLKVNYKSKQEGVRFLLLLKSFCERFSKFFCF
jgi:hypothetical protein